ncbi:MAG: 30S ribosome-binding factor RbfA [Pelovirga sp.]
MSSFRPERVGEQILKETTFLLLQRIKDPRIASVSLTGVKVSRDLSLARIYFTVHDLSDLQEAEAGLKSASPFIRRELSQIMKLRFMPEIKFQYDESISHGQRIDELLRQVQDDLDDSD